MKKVYVVTQGVYSDYHICGIFDDKETANLFIETFGNREYDEMDMEEWELNPCKIELRKGVKGYEVIMDKEGNTQRVSLENSDYSFRKDKRYEFRLNGDLCNYCFAESEQHAIKITNELRTRLIAENSWEI